MKLLTKSAAVLIVLLFTGTAFAHSPGINKRQHNQQKRIFQGIRSGELTKREVYRLGNEQRRIAKKERIFKADGKLTRRERAILQHDLNHASGHIYREKHDRQDRD
jgi:hypothetical protein